MELLSTELADRIVATNGRAAVNPTTEKIIEKRVGMLRFNTPPSVFVVNREGMILFPNAKLPFAKNEKLPQSLIASDETISKVDFAGKEGTTFVVKTPIHVNNSTVGYVLVMQNREELVHVDREYGLVAILLLFLGVSGWACIYYLSRKVVKPIKDVASAAREIEQGNYDIELPVDPKEKEVSELVDSFQHMSERLQHLEQLRTELLAGVTHELKTPVASISGLVQAVKDGVVKEDEADEFLQISLAEIRRLQTMVEDLMDFNSFLSGELSVQLDWHPLHSILQETVYQWNLVQKEDRITLQVEEIDSSLTVYVDPYRMKQILFNLFNNAQQAIEGAGTIVVRLQRGDQNEIIEVLDTGKGIKEEEQMLIFERFYRGSQKKMTQRGLGIGLPLSKLLAQAQGGDLTLGHSTPEGTTFALHLPR